MAGAAGSPVRVEWTLWRGFRQFSLKRLKPSGIDFFLASAISITYEEGSWMEMTSRHPNNLNLSRHFQARFGCLGRIEVDIKLGSEGTEGLEPQLGFEGVARELAFTELFKSVVVDFAFKQRAENLTGFIGGKDAIDEVEMMGLIVPFSVGC